MSDNAASPELLQTTRDQPDALAGGAPSPLANTPASTNLDSQALTSELGGLSLIDAFRHVKTLLRVSLAEQNRLINKNLTFQRLANQISNLTGDRDFTGFGRESDSLRVSPDATYNIILAKAAQFDEASESKASNPLQETAKTENPEIITNDIKHRELMEQIHSFLATASHDLTQWNEQAERVLDFSKGRDMMLENKVMRAIEKADHRQEPQGTPFKALDFTPQAQASTPSVSWKGVVTTMVEFTFGIILFFLLASLVAAVANWWNGP